MLRFWMACLMALLPLIASAVDVATPMGKLSVALPADFAALSRDDIKHKFSRNQQLPVAAFGNKAHTSTLAVSWGMLSSDFSDDQLPQLLSQLHTTYEQQMPGLKWITSETRVINGRTWLVLENVTPGRDTALHNAVYGTVIHGSLLMLNLNTTVAEHASYARAFQTAAASLVVR